MLLDIIGQFVGQDNYIVVPLMILKFYDGDYAKALIVSQIVNWSAHTSRADGYIWKSFKDWEDEICITRSRLERVVRELETAGHLDTKLEKVGSAPTKHYRMTAQFEHDLEAFLMDAKPVQKMIAPIEVKKQRGKYVEEFLQVKNEWFRLYKEKYGDNPIFPGKDAGLMKTLCSQRKPEEIIEKLKSFFNNSAWFTKNGHTFASFYNNYNAIIVKKRVDDPESYSCWDS